MFCYVPVKNTNYSYRREIKNVRKFELYGEPCFIFHMRYPGVKPLDSNVQMWFAFSFWLLIIWYEVYFIFSSGLITTFKSKIHSKQIIILTPFTLLMWSCGYLIRDFTINLWSQSVFPKLYHVSDNKMARESGSTDLSK